MAEHVSLQHLKQYGERRMLSSEALAVDRHLASCDTCYERFTQVADFTGMFKHVEHYLVSLAHEESSHLNYEEEVEPYIDDRIGEIEREIVESHLEICFQCREEVDQLFELKGLLYANPNPASRRQNISALLLRTLEAISPSRILTMLRPIPPLNQAFALTALIVFAVTVGAFLLRKESPGDASPNEEIARGETTSQPPQQQQLTPTEPRSLNPSTLPEQAAPTPTTGRPTASSEQVLVALNDGPRQISLNNRGKLTGLETLAPDLRQQVLIALNSGIPKADSLRRLEQSAEVRGGDAEGNQTKESRTFSFITPMGVVLRDDRPTFSWVEYLGATSYKVMVFDENNRKVADSNKLVPSKSWRPNERLPRGPRGVVYSWKLIAVTEDGKEITAVGETGPPKFSILGEEELQRLERIERLYPDSHLILGVAYANLGLREQAEREFKKLVDANPGSPLAKKLLRGVRSWRGSK